MRLYPQFKSITIHSLEDEIVTKETIVTKVTVVTGDSRDSRDSSDRSDQRLEHTAIIMCNTTD